MFSTVWLPLTFLFIQSSFSKYSAFGPAVYQLTEPVEHGEGPTWDSRTGLLYFVDIHAGRIVSYDPKNGETFFIKLNGTVTPVVQTKRDPHKFVVGLNRSIALISWDGKHQTKDQRILTTVSQRFPTSRFNDGKADKRGRLWFGTMGFEDDSGVAPNAGALYFVTKQNLENPDIAIAPVNVSNGLAWNKANDKFYYIDTPTQTVVVYDYEDSTGRISNRTIVYDFKRGLGDFALPDGMTIDEEDNLWIALYGGGSVVKIDPIQKKLLQRIAIPAKYVSSAMWGGENLDVLFVTTSMIKLTVEERKTQPGAGGLFGITGLGTRGLPVFQADVV